MFLNRWLRNSVGLFFCVCAIVCCFVQLIRIISVVLCGTVFILVASILKYKYREFFLSCLSARYYVGKVEEIQFQGPTNRFVRVAIV
jgi:hypothetical protein